MTPCPRSFAPSPKPLTAAGVIALALALLAPLPARAQSVPWAELPGGRKLSPAQKKVAEGALRETRAYGRCTDAVLKCLASRPRDKLAWRLAGYIVYLADKDLTADEVKKVVGRRRDSAAPAKLHTIPPGTAPRLGDPKAPVTVVEFADFECGHCADLSPVLEGLVKKPLKGKVVLYFKPYPLKTEGGRLLAAQAALAAHRQGKFWEMAHLLFEEIELHTADGMERLARKVGLDVDRFRAAMKDRNLLKEIEANKILGLRLGIEGTPAIFINGKAYRLPHDEQHLRDRLEEELELIEIKKPGLEIKKPGQ